MDDKKQSIIAKIEKLLRLGESPNENEAAAAVSKAHALMEQYQIESFELDAQDNDVCGVIDNDLETQGRWDKWLKVLFINLGEIFDCNVYFFSRINAGKTQITLRVIGLKTDAALLETMFKYLRGIIHRLYLTAWEKDKDQYALYFQTQRKAAAAFKKSFCAGCVERITVRLETAKQERAQAEVKCRDLIVLKNALVERFIVQSRYSFVIGKAIKQNIYRKAYEEGFAAGGSVRLQPTAGYLHRNTRMHNDI